MRVTPEPVSGHALALVLAFSPAASTFKQALMNAGIPVAVALAQELEPGQTATVSGLLMGFTWGFAGLFYAPIGRLIEAFGVLPVLLGLGVLLLPAWALARGVRAPARTMGV